MELPWDSGRYGAWWPAEDHIRHVQPYNAIWRSFLEGYGDRITQRDALKFGRHIARYYDLQTYF